MDTPVQCCRCRNKHMRSERIDALRNGIMVDAINLGSAAGQKARLDRGIGQDSQALIGG